MDSNLPPEDNAPPPLNPSPAPPPLFNAPPPMPNRPPPVIAASAPPRPARKGTGWRVFAVILLILLGLSMMFNVRQAFLSAVNLKVPGARESGPRLEEVTVRNLDAANKIVVIPVDGVITSQVSDQGGINMVSLIKAQLKLAKSDKEVKAVILKVDSPGGEVLASDEINKAITEFQDKSGKPVVVSMGNLAASGGYYISAPCEWIVANELTITGSIGVIMHGFNYRGLLDKIGVRPEVYKSGKFKDMLSGTKEQDEISPEEREMVQNLINETFDKFKNVVADGRHAAYQTNKRTGQPLSPDWEDYADGRILSGKEAYRLGFVDELGDFDTAVKRAEDLARIKTTHANLIQYQPVFDISNFFRLLGKTDAKGVKIDLGVDVPRLRAGYLYFLAPTYFH